MNDALALMPDGKAFISWERPSAVIRTLHVDQHHPQADDDNPGTAERPFATINAAAQIVSPGDLVLVHPGHYREWVRPATGGIDAEHLVQFVADPAGEVVISGSEVFTGVWQRSSGWELIDKADVPNTPTVWMIDLPRAWFVGYNPFATPNQTQTMDQWDDMTAIAGILPAFLRRRGLVFQDGRRLTQVHKLRDLLARDGAYWVEADGLTIHLRPFADAAPQALRWELTAREQAFAPEVRYLGYLRVAGFTIEHIADAFPVPQGGALSASRGHHWIIENNVVRQINAIGIDMGRQNWLCTKPTIAGHHIIRRNVIEDCGICGIAGVGPMEGLLVEDNRLARCCWQDVENYFECAAIKIHLVWRGLIRRNVILDTHGGAGIWMDWDNRHARATQNVIIGTRSQFGGIFLEASHTANLVDSNIILDTEGHGIYTHDSDRVTVAHNLIARASKAAVFLKLGEPKRWVMGRGASCRQHRVLNNIVTDTATALEFGTPHSTSDWNLFGKDGGEGPLRIHRPEENLHLTAWRDFHGQDLHSATADITVVYDRTSSILVCTIAGIVPACPALPEVPTDFSGVDHGRTTTPGPFARQPVPGEISKNLHVDVRQ